MRKYLLVALLFVLFTSLPAFGYSTIKATEPIEESWGKLIKTGTAVDGNTIFYNLTFENNNSYVIATYISDYLTGSQSLDRVFILPKRKENKE